MWWKKCSIDNVYVPQPPRESSLVWQAPPAGNWVVQAATVLPGNMLLSTWCKKIRYMSPIHRVPSCIVKEKRKIAMVNCCADPQVEGLKAHQDCMATLQHHQSHTAHGSRHHCCPQSPLLAHVFIDQKVLWNELYMKMKIETFLQIPPFLQTTHLGMPIESVAKSIPNYNAQYMPANSKQVHIL